MKIKVSIPESNLDGFLEQIDKINRKLEKAGSPKTALTKVGYNDIPFNINLNCTSVRIFDYEIDYQSPQIDDWIFVGRIEHNPTAGLPNIFVSIPGNAIPETYRTSKCSCDHCKVDRYRKHTFVVENGNNKEQRQVGSTCLKDFFGGRDIESALHAFELLEDIEELSKKSKVSFTNFQAEVVRIDLKHFVAAVTAIARTQGFVSKSMAFHTHNSKTPTADTAWSYEYSLKAGNITDIITDNDRDTANKHINWIRNLPDSECRSEYLRNLKAICRQDRICWKERGYVASISVAFNKNNRQAVASNSQHVGQLGEKLDLKVKIVRVSPTRFGHMFKMTDAGGNIFVYFGTHRSFGNEGDVIKITGKVKKHDTFMGTKQTTLNFCKLS